MTRLPENTFRALRHLALALAAQHEAVDLDALADPARLTLDRRIDCAAVERAARSAGLIVN